MFPGFSNEQAVIRPQQLQRCTGQGAETGVAVSAPLNSQVPGLSNRSLGAKSSEKLSFREVTVSAIENYIMPELAIYVMWSCREERLT